jgi:hypothetical protein
MATPSRKPATLADLVARGDCDRLEIVAGEIVEKALPSPAHAAAELELAHYWVLDPEERILLVHRWSRDGHVVVQRAASGELGRAEPFEAIELRVGLLFGDDQG